MPKVWLSRQRDGNYMMTRFQPVRAEVGRTGLNYFYIIAGEPIGMRHLCPGGTKYFFGIELEIGEQIYVDLELKTTELKRCPAVQPQSEKESKNDES